MTAKRKTTTTLSIVYRCWYCMKTKSKYIHQLPLEQLLPVNPGGHVGATVGIMLATVGAISLADGDGVVGLIDDM